MKKIYFLLLMMNAATSFGQQGIAIGSTTVHNSAIVDMSKSTKGLLIPRLTQTSRLFISNPAEGLMVYDTTTNRFYQYQNAVWRYMINNSFWNRSSISNYVYSFDSIGIGTLSPDSRLDVNGNLRGRSSMEVSGQISAANTLQAVNMDATSTIAAGGYAAVTGDISTNGDVSINNADPILQIENANVNKVFIQASGDDMRLGTNSGNTLGKTIIRMNGTDIISIDTSATMKVLIGGSGGNISYGTKVQRQLAPDENMCPILSGRVYNNGTQAWLSTDGIITRVSFGTYEVQSYSARVSARASILVNASGTSPVIATATFISGTKFKVELVDLLTNSFADGDFNFIVTDPLNLF